MLKTWILSTLFLAKSLLAMPQFYTDHAIKNNIDPNQLYAVALANAGLTNSYNHYLPYPWSLTVNGHYYQFKYKQELFIYLKAQLQKTKNKITYGVAGVPLVKQSLQSLWDSLAIDYQLNYATNQLKKINCSQLVDCVANYRKLTRFSVFPTYKIIASKKGKVRTPPKAPKDLITLVKRISEKTGVEKALIHAIIARESAYKIKAKSHAGAMGLMQLMPGTAKYVGLKKSQVYTPYYNILGGAKYIKEQLANFGGNLELALAAYNAGPGNVRKYKGIPPFKETKKYVPIVISYYRYFKGEGARVI